MEILAVGGEEEPNRRWARLASFRDKYAGFSESGIGRNGVAK
jgi:hypothetical protein